MSNDLLCILNLADQSYLSQRSLFTTKTWQTLIDHYASKFAVSPVDDNSTLKDIWRIVCVATAAEQCVAFGMKYLYQMLAIYENDGVMPCLTTFLPALKQVDGVSDKLSEHTPKSLVDRTEQDFINYIWFPLLVELFPVGGSIRLKRGESTYDHYSECKADMYPASSNIIGFKVDTRFLVDHEGKEYDVCLAEVAKSNDDTKTISDKAKLNRVVSAK